MRVLLLFFVGGRLEVVGWVGMRRRNWRHREKQRDAERHRETQRALRQTQRDTESA